jgi:hypothetical protein
MPTDEQLALGPPKVSFSNWMMGGDLVMVPWKPHTLAPHKRMELTTVNNNKQIVKRHLKALKPAGGKSKESEKVSEKNEEKKADDEGGGVSLDLSRRMRPLLSFPSPRIRVHHHS